MADITNPTAVAFCNEKVRRVADALAEHYFRAKEIIAEWLARGGADFVANDPAAEVIDGAQEDRRPVIDGADVNNIINREVEFVADMEADDFAKLNTVLAVAVNYRKAA